MSKVKRSVDLTPPAGEQTTEVLKSALHECRYCGGRGYFTTAYPFPEDNPKDCPVCKGNGFVDAIIRIEWRPSEL